jgi:hypothetical protein
MNEHSDGPKSIEMSTEIGTIFVSPTCLKAANLIGPNLNIDGTPVHVTAFFVSSDGVDFDLIRHSIMKADSFQRPQFARA